MTAVPPSAKVVKVDRDSVWVECPYCTDTHRHPRHDRQEARGGREHRAPGCGWMLGPDERAAGYRFQLEEVR